MKEPGSTQLMRHVIVTDGVARWTRNGTAREFEIKELPEKFIHWQLDYKNSIYKTIDKDEYMDRYLAVVESAVEEILKLPPHAVDETRKLRLSAARELYAHPEHIDWRRVCLLEIFEGTTYLNLTQNPFASVLWTGNSPVFVSYQVDCIVEVITSDDPRYRFSWAMRRLFEYEPFHIVQTMFPFAYTFWVYDWKEKTPVRRYK